MSWLSDIGGWLGGSSSLVESQGSGGTDFSWNDAKDILNFGRQVYNTFDMNNSRQGTRGDILDMLRQQEGADNDYQRRLWEYQNAQRGAAAGAARANDAARRKAANKAFKQQSKMLKALIAQYQPYADAARDLTPKMSQNYSQFLDTTALLNQYLTPKAMEFLGSQPKPASQMNIPQAAYKVTVPESAPVSFLMPEDPLKRK
jgi:hypothetical protein